MMLLYGETSHMSIITDSRPMLLGSKFVPIRKRYNGVNWFGSHKALLVTVLSLGLRCEIGSPQILGCGIGDKISHVFFVVSQAESRDHLGVVLVHAYRPRFEPYQPLK